MSEWEGTRALYSDAYAVIEEVDEYSPIHIRSKLREFIRNFQLDHTFIYREQLLRQYRKREFRLDVNLRHLGLYDDGLLNSLRISPQEVMILFEEAAKEALAQAIAVGVHMDHSHVPDFQVTVFSDETPAALRAVSSTDVNKLVVVPGIITSASRTRPKATVIMLNCGNCKQTKSISLDGSTGTAQAPKECWNEDCRKEVKKANLSLSAERSLFVDQQSLKLQESPEVVPTGEMPRSIMLSVERYLVDQVSPGTRVSVFGISSVFNGTSEKGGALRTPFLRVIGMTVTSEGSGKSEHHYSDREEELFKDIARSPNVYDKIVKSIAPAISGAYTVDIKKAIACLLFGGSRRRLPDGLKLRGDINVLLLGDPSTAKSQFLKFVERVAPVGVYTSGKGSSAAGLTASVIRDARGEFFLEGGAMVLADGGVVCIDEFDKMREQDRVAIHEAMEQQTISVAKAGITTILNSRASVLAAANPAFGTFNESKSAAENINFLPTILSRFDMIFLVRDTKDQEKDRSIARHVLGIHVGYSGGSRAPNQANVASKDGELDLSTLKKYIGYCRARFAPCLSPDAAESLRNHYVNIREEHRRKRSERHSNSSVPITVRQLEAIVRITESLAKMEQATEATAAHVAEAIRLFQVSTLHAAQNGSGPADMVQMGSEMSQDVQQVEERLQRLLAINQQLPTKVLLDELISKLGFPSTAVHRAVQVMIARGEILPLHQQKFLKRIR